MKTNQATYHVFISHSHKDQELVRDIMRRLRAAGLEPEVTIEAVSLGVERKKALRDSLRKADAVLILVTPAGLDSPWLMTELGMAEGFDKVVLPVVAGLGAHHLPLPLQTYKVLPFDQLDEAIRQLIQQLAEKPEN